MSERLAARIQISPQLLSVCSPAPDSTYTLAESLIDLYQWTLCAKAKARWLPAWLWVCWEAWLSWQKLASVCITVQFKFPSVTWDGSCYAFLSRISYMREMRGTWGKAHTEGKQFGVSHTCEAAVFDEVLVFGLAFIYSLVCVIDSVFDQHSESSKFVSMNST